MDLAARRPRLADLLPRALGLPVLRRGGGHDRGGGPPVLPAHDPARRRLADRALHADLPAAVLDRPATDGEGPRAAADRCAAAAVLLLLLHGLDAAGAARRPAPGRHDLPGERGLPG